ncbi:MAG: hypothetical protein MK188_11540, partial [Gammaproteobacteria bacterium]|nr:hypothetical protein [Gammaproteobacteria bacterium]
GYVHALTILPDAYRRKHNKYLYRVLHEQPATWDVGKKGNLCLMCHSIGAHQTSRDIDKPLNMSIMNQLATGKVMSLREGSNAANCYSKRKNSKCPSPTTTGYHPFMEGMMGATQAELQAALDDIKKCFVEKVKRPKDCVVRNPK